jgi:hypothetical protein
VYLAHRQREDRRDTFRHYSSVDSRVSSTADDGERPQTRKNLATTTVSKKFFDPGQSEGTFAEHCRACDSIRAGCRLHPRDPLSVDWDGSRYAPIEAAS